LSASQSINVLNVAPSTIISLRFTDVNFSTAPIASLQKNAPVYLEMQAADIDPEQQDAVYVVLSSSVSDPAGIVIPLTQIDNTSPIYRGTAYLGGISDPSFVMLSATRNGELITATALANA